MRTLINEIIGYHVRAAQRWKTFTKGQKKTVLLAIPLAILLFDALFCFGVYVGMNVLYWAGYDVQYISAGDMPYYPLFPEIFLFQVVVFAAQFVFIIRYSRNINNASRDE